MIKLLHNAHCRLTRLNQDWASIRNYQQVLDNVIRPVAGYTSVMPFRIKQCTIIVSTHAAASIMLEAAAQVAQVRIARPKAQVSLIPAELM